MEEEASRGRESGTEEKTVHCPHCAAVLTKEDITVIMFPRATVLACPRCKKSLSLNLADL